MAMKQTKNGGTFSGPKRADNAGSDNSKSAVRQSSITNGGANVRIKARNNSGQNTGSAGNSSQPPPLRSAGRAQGMSLSSAKAKKHIKQQSGFVMNQTINVSHQRVIYHSNSLSMLSACNRTYSRLQPSNRR